MELGNGEEAVQEETEPEAKRRRLLCTEFASVASCDAAVAQGYLAENNWEMEVRARRGCSRPRPGRRVAAACPVLCLCFSEGVELLLRAGRGGQRRGKPARSPRGARALVSLGRSAGSVGCGRAPGAGALRRHRRVYPEVGRAFGTGVRVREGNLRCDYLIVYVCET